MIDFLLAPPGVITIIVVVVLIVIIGIGAVIASDTGYEYLFIIPFLLGVIYLLWHGGAWVVARFMNTVQSYR